MQYVSAACVRVVYRGWGFQDFAHPYPSLETGWSNALSFWDSPKIKCLAPEEETPPGPLLGDTDG